MTSDSSLQEVLTLASLSLIAFCAKSKHKRQTSCLPQAQPLSPSSDKEDLLGAFPQVPILEFEIKTRSIASCNGLTKHSLSINVARAGFPSSAPQVGWPLNSTSLRKVCFRVFRVCCHLRQIKYICSDSIVRLLCHYLSDY